MRGREAADIILSALNKITFRNPALSKCNLALNAVSMLAKAAWIAMITGSREIDGEQEFCQLLGEALGLLNGFGATKHMINELYEATCVKPEISTKYHGILKELAETGEVELDLGAEG